MKIVCDRCRKILSDGGKRLHSATFDTGIPHRHKNTKATMYALCDRCWARIKAKEAKPCWCSKMFGQHSLNCPANPTKNQGYD